MPEYQNERFEIERYRDPREVTNKLEAALSLRKRALQTANSRMREFLIQVAERLEREADSLKKGML